MICKLKVKEVAEMAVVVHCTYSNTLDYNNYYIIAFYITTG